MDKKCPHCGAGFSYGNHADGSMFVRWACESDNRGTRGDKCRIAEAIAVGIDLEVDHVDISGGRIAAVANEMPLFEKPPAVQRNLLEESA